MPAGPGWNHDTTGNVQDALVRAAEASGCDPEPCSEHATRRTAKRGSRRRMQVEHYLQPGVTGVDRSSRVPGLPLHELHDLGPDRHIHVSVIIHRHLAGEVESGVRTIPLGHELAGG